MNDRILNKEDILCMQYAGMKSSRILYLCPNSAQTCLRDA